MGVGPERIMGGLKVGICASLTSYMRFVCLETDGEVCR